MLMKFRAKYLTALTGRIEYNQPLELIRSRVGERVQVEIATSHWGLDPNAFEHRWDSMSTADGVLAYADDSKIRLDTSNGTREIKYTGVKEDIGEHEGTVLSPHTSEHLVTRIVTGDGQNLLRGFVEEN